MKIGRKIIIFRYNLVRIKSGVFQDVFATFVLLSAHPAGFFLAKHLIFDFLEIAIFEEISFRRKLDVLFLISRDIS